MDRTISLITVLLVLLLAGMVAGQDQDESAPKPPPPQQQQPGSPCPRIDVQAQSARVVRDGQPLIFVAGIHGGDPKIVPQIIWSVSGGSIVNGQQTRRIDVDSTGAGVYREVSANVWIGGYPPECITQASATVRVIPPPAKTDEFGELDAQKEKDRLAAAIASLGQSDDRLYVIIYAGRKSERGYAANALRRIHSELVNGGMKEDHVAVVDGGFREQPSYEIWAVPQGAEFPKPAPTVDRREIVYPKPAVPQRKPAKP